jgi:hypothetical protein
VHPFRAAVASSVALVVTVGVARAQSAGDLATGLRQVKEGDFAGAIVTLDPIARGVAGNADAGEMSQAHLHLGMAFLGLAQDAKAHEHFKDALRLDPVLRLAKGRHPSRVFEAFEAARKELLREQGHKPRSWRPFAVTGAVAVASAVGVARAKEAREDAGQAQFFGARFAVATTVCPNGSTGVVIPVPLFLEATNETAMEVPITRLSTTLVVETTTVAGETGFQSTRPSNFTPRSLTSGQQATLQVETGLSCTNAIGDAPRFTEVSARVEVVTPAGTFVLPTPDRLRVDFP